MVGAMCRRVFRRVTKIPMQYDRYYYFKIEWKLRPVTKRRGR